MAEPTGKTWILKPRPGFEWARITWHVMQEDEEHCSYCSHAIPETVVPLRLYRHSDGSAAVFCDPCMVTWWGMDPPDTPLDERGFGTPDDNDPGEEL